MQGVYIDSFHTQKAGNAVSEYEERFLDTGDHCGAPGGKCAHCDRRRRHRRCVQRAMGATAGKGPDDRRDCPASPHPSRAGVGRVVGRRPLPWYTEEKARGGASAALIRLELSRGVAKGAGHQER
jgi:hypothetical protein